MNSLNAILIEGNLTKDPELNETPKGTSVCHFSVASNRYYKVNDEGQSEVSFFDVEAWSKLAETCNEHLSKGQGVRVTGRLKQDRWVGTDGKNYSKIKIVADAIEFKPMFSKKDEANKQKELQPAEV